MDDPGSWSVVLALSWTFPLLLVVVIFLTLFFSVTGLALRYISWVKLEEAFEEQGYPDRIRILRERMNRLVACSAVLRLLGNLAVLMFVIFHFTLEPDQVTELLDLWKAFAASAVVLLVFSVAIPHAWAKHAGTQFLVFFYPLLRVVEWLIWPITTVLGVFDPLIRRLAGVSVEDANGTLDDKQEELMNVVEEGEKEGVVDEQEREMIASVLEFRDQTAGEIMTPRTDVVGIAADVKLSEAAEIITTAGHSRYPVYDNTIDQIIGLLYAKDLLLDINNPDGNGNSIRHRMRSAYFVPESKPLRDLLHDFQSQKIHLAVVLDEYGGTAGVVSIEDVLEELVGEIFDEYEAAQDEPILRVDEQTIEVDGRVHVDELNDEYELEIPEDEDYETIGGFAFTQLGHIPQNGETFEHERLIFTVIDVEPRKINRLRIFQKPREEEKNNGKKKNGNDDADGK